MINPIPLLTLLLKGYNGTPHRLIFRWPTLTSTTLLHIMSCGILAKHHSTMACHIVDFPSVHLDLRFGVRRSLFMVQLFLPSS